MKRIRLLLFFLYVLAFNVNSYAQENEGDEYRNVVKALITANKKYQTSTATLLVGLPNIKEYDIRMLIFEEEYPRRSDLQRAWKKYQENQLCEDLTDVFVMVCSQDFSISDLKQMEENLPALELNNKFLSNKEQILQNFGNSLYHYLRDEFKGFEEPDCPNSYKQLCQKYYHLSGMDAEFDKRQQALLGIEAYTRHKKEVRAYFEENSIVFFMRICYNLLSEENLHICVNYLSSTSPLYNQLQKLSDDHRQQIKALCQKRFRLWFKQEEPELYAILQEWENDFGSGMQEE